MKGLNAIVLTGGESRRMGASKGELDYWGKAQQYRVYEMLSSYCNKVFISCRKPQAALVDSGYEVLVDNTELGEIGPMNVLISSFEYARSAWLVIGCDYPLFGLQEIENLVLNRDESRPATAIWNRSIRKPEPLLAIYEPALFESLLPEGGIPAQGAYRLRCQGGVAAGARGDRERGYIGEIFGDQKADR